jgi:hypothetical protein
VGKTGRMQGMSKKKQNAHPHGHSIFLHVPQTVLEKIHWTRYSLIVLTKSAQMLMVANTPSSWMPCAFFFGDISYTAFQKKTSMKDLVYVMSILGFILYIS